MTHYLHLFSQDRFMQQQLTIRHINSPHVKIQINANVVHAFIIIILYNGKIIIVPIKYA